MHPGSRNEELTIPALVRHLATSIFWPSPKEKYPWRENGFAFGQPRLGDGLRTSLGYLLFLNIEYRCGVSLVASKPFLTPCPCTRTIALH